MVLIQAQQLGTGSRYGLETFHQCGKRVKTKVRKSLGLIPTFAEVTEENLVARGAFLPPILNRVNVTCIENLSKF